MSEEQAVLIDSEIALAYTLLLNHPNLGVPELAARLDRTEEEARTLLDQMVDLSLLHRREQKRAPLVATHPIEEQLPQRLEGGDCTPLERSIVRLLATGAKDDAVARQLGLSVRTLRRGIAELMERLKATSRFQLGVRVAALGWLDRVGDGTAGRPAEVTG